MFNGGGYKSRSSCKQFFEKNKFLDCQYRNSKRAPTRATRRDLLQRSYNNAGIFESTRCDGRNYRRRRLSSIRLVSLILRMTIYQIFRGYRLSRWRKLALHCRPPKRTHKSQRIPSPSGGTRRFTSFPSCGPRLRCYWYTRCQKWRSPKSFCGKKKWPTFWTRSYYICQK